MLDRTQDPPDFINEGGVKWWHEPSMTNYAHQKGLKKVRVWLVEKPDGYRSLVVTEGEDILFDDQTIEGLGCQMDMLAYLRQL